MKRAIFVLASILVVLVVLIAVLVVRPLRKVKAQTGCSNRTLMGNYGWTEFGTEFEYTPPEFWTFSALVHFDGNGKFTGSESYYIENGAPDPLNGTSGSDSAGTYTVNSNCTVTITYTWAGDTYSDHGVVVGANGSEVIADEYDETTSDTTGHVDMMKVADSDER